MDNTAQAQDDITVDSVAESPTVETVEQDDKTVDASASPDSSQEKESGGKETTAAQKRINQLTWKAHEAERRAEELEQRLREKEQTAPDPAPTQKPKLSDFEDEEDFADAIAAYAVSQVQETFTEREKREAQQAAESQRQTRLARYRESVQEYVAGNAEALEDIQAAASLNLPQDVLDVITETEMPGPVTHYLAKNPEHALKLINMSAGRAGMEIAKIESALATSKSTSAAPAPLTEVDEVSTVVNDGPSSNDSTEAWMAKRRAQVKAKRENGEHIR